MSLSRIKGKITRIFIKLSAITEKNIHMNFRFKYTTIVGYLNVLVSVLMPVIIFGQFFSIRGDIGPWNAQNYMVFILVGYTILLLRRMIKEVPRQLMYEKFFKTLPALIIAPFNRFYLLFGYFISELVMILPPVICVIIVTYILYPISIFTLIFAILLFFGIAMTFAGIGFMIGVFAISNESILAIFGFFINLIIWASCVTYPYELFPSQVQFFIDFNPIFHMIHFLRLIWIENNIILTIVIHPLETVILLGSLIIFPTLGVINFNYIYKKLGATGY
ncbi:MAG: ABC transporter permease [Promethearchaeota archaeon]